MKVFRLSGFEEQKDLKALCKSPGEEAPVSLRCFTSNPLSDTLIEVQFVRGVGVEGAGRTMTGTSGFRSRSTLEERRATKGSGRTTFGSLNDNEGHF